MATGIGNQITKQIGEYLACAELGRRGYIATTFSGSVPTFDIIAIDSRNRSLPIQVKAINGGSWQFDATKFLEISFASNDKQIVKKMIRLPHPDLICIFVNLVGQGKDEFFVFELKDLQEIVHANYKHWIDIHGGIRPKNPKSTHVSVSASDLKIYRDNWALLSP